VRTQDELIEQIRTTLLHELGHLRGEDDAELRARGLE
jgi:predicted Zn-dependent protease with MMP-like domain